MLALSSDQYELISSWLRPIFPIFQSSVSDNTRKGEHVDELALLVGHELGGRLRVVQGDSWYTEKQK